MPNKAVFPLAKVRAIVPVTETSDSHNLLGLATLGGTIINRNDPICVMQPRQVRKAISCRNITGIMAYKQCQCTLALSLICHYKLYNVDGSKTAWEKENWSQ